MFSHANDRIMTGDHLYRLDDVWVAAVNALPDPRPLAALLRSDTPMTIGARKLLAEMFHPGDPPLTDQRLVVRHNPDFDRMIRQLGVTVHYRQALAPGGWLSRRAISASRWRCDDR
jgi:hypothetical protein